MRRVFLSFSAFLMLIPASLLPAYAQSHCKTYFTIRPLDSSAVKLLDAPVAPSSQTDSSDLSPEKLRDWDLPSKVSPWRARLSPAEAAGLQQQINKANAAAQSNDQSKKNAEVTIPGPPRPYNLQPFSSRDWDDLEKWFAKNGPKRLPGLCVDSTKAAYALAVGVVTGGRIGLSPNDAIDRISSQQAAVIRNPDAAMGPDGVTASSVVHSATSGEFTGLPTPGGGAAYTCVYLYRANASPTARGGNTQKLPAYYYCKSGGVLPHSSITTMLKYFAKAGLP
jgi:hypothetical protein